MIDAAPMVVFNMPAAPLAEPAKTAKPKYLEEAKRYIAQHEGVKNQVYKDSKDLPTVGVGHLIRPGQMKKYEGRVLPLSEIDELFESDLSEKEKLVRAKLGNSFDEMPDELKVAVLDGFFRGDLSGSPNALKLLKAGKYAEAADEYLDNREYRASVAKNKAGKAHGVAKRMERNAARMKLAASRKLSTE